MSDVNPFAKLPDDINPYAAPTAPYVEGDGKGGTAEGVRRAHISHEASVKSIGLLYLLGAVLVIFMSVMLLGAALSAAAPNTGDPAFAVFLLVLGLGQGAVGIGLRRLKKWTRIPVGLLSGIGLLAVPLGTLINGYILYLVFSAKGRTVFSDEYKTIIQQTPHVQYKTSIVVWIFLALLVGVIGLAILGVVFSG